MRVRERTPQQLDPVGVLVGRPIVPLTAALALAYAVYSTIMHTHQLTHPAIAWLSVALLAAAGGVFVYCSSPVRAPLSRGQHVLVVGLVMVAALLFTLSVWGTNRLIQDDWGQIAVALMLLAMALFRPPAEVMISGGICAVILGVVAMAEAPFLVITNNPLVYGTVAATPILILSFAAAAYARVMTDAVDRWAVRAREAIAGLEPEVREGAARGVHQDQVTLLNQSAVPLLSGLLDRGELTQTDIDAAGAVAAQLRTHARADVDRGWLAETVMRATGSAPRTNSDRRITAVRIEDPARLAEQMPADQRGTLSAFIVVLARTGALDKDSLSIDLTAAARQCVLNLRASVDLADRQLRRLLVPYLSVLRVISDDAALRVRSGNVTLEYRYDRL